MPTPSSWSPEQYPVMNSLFCSNFLELVNGITFAVQKLGHCEALNAKSNSLLLKEKLGVSASLLIKWGCTGNGIYGERGSLHLLPISMWIFSHLFKVQESVVFWASFRGDFSLCRCIFSVSMGGEEFRGLLCHHFGWLLFSLVICLRKSLFFFTFEG